MACSSKEQLLVGSNPTVNSPSSVVSMAEWSKAPDSSSGLRKGAWVRTPLLTNQSTSSFALSLSHGETWIPMVDLLFLS